MTAIGHIPPSANPLGVLEAEVSILERVLELHERREALRQQLKGVSDCAGLIDEALDTAGIARAVAARHGLTLDDFRSVARGRAVAWPRQEAMALMYARGKWSTTQIGRFLGNRDHTTVMYGIRAHARRQYAKRHDSAAAIYQGGSDA